MASGVTLPEKQVLQTKTKAKATYTRPTQKKTKTRQKHETRAGATGKSKDNKRGLERLSKNRNQPNKINIDEKNLSDVIF